MNYLWHILVLIDLYIILALSLNLIVGCTGLMSLCHAAFYGVGAYTVALLTTSGWSFLPALSMAVLLAGLLSLIVAVPALRLRGDYFVLATLGFQVIVFGVLYNWVSLTRGPFGIGAIPIPSVIGWEVNSAFRYFVFTAVFALGCSAIVWALMASPFGRLLKAIREDEIAVAALGKNVSLSKVTVFVIGAALAAVPGGLFAGYARYIDPTSFTLAEAIFILSIVVIGGAGSFRGPLLGAGIMVLLPELLRALYLPDAIAANIRQIIYGLLLVLLMRFRPQGFWGDYRFD
jgi:branched-chain amino acid transport system permease protein